MNDEPDSVEEMSAHDDRIGIDIPLPKDCTLVQALRVLCRNEPRSVRKTMILAADQLETQAARIALLEAGLSPKESDNHRLCLEHLAKCEEAKAMQDRIAELELELDNANNRAEKFKAQIPESPFHQTRRLSVAANAKTQDRIAELESALNRVLKASLSGQGQVSFIRACNAAKKALEGSDG